MPSPTPLPERKRAIAGELPASILVIDREPQHLVQLRRALQGPERRIFEATAAALAERLIESVAVDLLVIDVDFGDTEALIGRARRRSPGLPVVVTSGRQGALADVRQLVDGYLPRPFRSDLAIRLAATDAMARAGLRRRSTTERPLPHDADGPALSAG